MTWGDPGSGGDSSEVQDQLKDVRAAFKQLQACICGDPGGWVGRDMGQSI